MQIFVYLLVVALGFRTLLSLHRYRWRKLPVKGGDMPAVSLLIPSRNETHAITRSLSNALALDYPKLEIIVLDDESGDNTTEKIRAFAQEGVRFIAGKPLPDGWVGKNWACHQLSQHASGKYMVFCDVDVHLNSLTLTRMVRLFEQEALDCASVLPKLVTDSQLSSITAPLMHWWLMTIIPFLRSFPPAFGGFLIFNAASYRRHGGFDRYRKSVIPEIPLSRDFSKHKKYRFFYSTGALFLELRKKPSSTHETRLRYFWPLYNYSPPFMALHVGLLVLPLLFLGQPTLYVLLLLPFALTMRMGLRHWLLPVIFWPLTCLFELTLASVSIFKNVTGTITWKSRHIQS